MESPIYNGEVIVGGTKQTQVFKALPDSIITRQSGDLTLRFVENVSGGLPFDISSLTGADLLTVPVGSGEIPTTLATGVVGFSQEIFTITTASIAPTSGTFIIRVAGENTTAIAYNADAATVLAALIALPSRSGGDFIVSILEGENLSFAGAQLQVETSGGFAISFKSTLDGSSLVVADSISLDNIQEGSDIQNEYNASWNKDTMPASFATFDVSPTGAIAIYISMEDADDFYQPFQQINVTDGDFIGQGGSIPSLAVYVYTPADSNAWLRVSTASPVSISSGLDKIVDKPFRDFGTVLGQQTAPPGSPADRDSYIVLSPATGLWTGFEQKIATWSVTLAVWSFSNVHRAWDEVRDASDGQVYRYNTTGPAWDIVTASIALPVDDTTELVRDPGDNTKTMRIDVGAVATATTRTLSMPDNDVDLADIASFLSHLANLSNPHIVTASQVGNLIAQWNALQLFGKTLSAAMATPTNGSVPTYNSGSGEYDPVVPSSGTGGAGIAFQTNFETSVDGTEPASGGQKFNSATLASVTTIRVSTTDANGVNITDRLSTIGSGDSYYTRDLNDNTKWLKVNVVSSSFITTSYDIVCSFDSGGILPAAAATMGIDPAILTVGASTGVALWNSRAGNVIPALGDYLASLINDDSGVGGTTVADSLDILNLSISPEGVAGGTDNNQTGVAYTLVLTDKDNKNIYMDNALVNAATIPLNSSVAFPIGTTKIPIIQEGVGVTTIDGAVGVTINGVLNGSVVINNQFQGAVAQKRGTNNWLVSGDIS